MTELTGLLMRGMVYWMIARAIYAVLPFYDSRNPESPANPYSPANSALRQEIEREHALLLAERARVRRRLEWQARYEGVTTEGWSDEMLGLPTLPKKSFDWKVSALTEYHPVFLTVGVAILCITLDTVARLYLPEIIKVAGPRADLFLKITVVWLAARVFYYLNPLHDPCRPDSPLSPFHPSNVRVRYLIEQRVKAEGGNTALIRDWYTIWALLYPTLLTVLFILIFPIGS